ncbi:MAG: PEP-CTERM sorting domain-containing protein [Kiritimatiellales bacterium]
MKKQWIVALVVMLSVAVARANLVSISVDATSITVNQDVTWTINEGVAASYFFFIFDNVVTYDGTDSVDAVLDVLEYSVNGGGRLSITLWSDQLGVNMADMTENDGYLVDSNMTKISAGDTVTLYAGTATFDFGGLTGANMWSSGTYDVFLANSEGKNITSAVPEPATAGLLGISCGVLWLVRRLKKAMNYYRT